MTNPDRPLHRLTSLRHLAGLRRHRPFTAGWLLPILVLAVLVAPALPAGAAGICSKTSHAARVACGFEVLDDFWNAYAICLNESEAGDRRDCIAEARDERRDGREECGEQLDARLDLCDQIGEAAYDPEFDPDDFETDYADPTSPNPYRPLGIGNRWEYAGGDETITIEVFDQTKRIDGIDCIVVNDVVEVDGELVEDTDDWFALDLDGNVHYCGESVRDFEIFEGDDPELPELVSIEGSFKAGVEGARSGLLFAASPSVGDVYRQEWALGNAEDAAEVLSTSYGYGDDDELDFAVPEELAELLCDDDCVVTFEFSPLDPEAREHKYFAPGVGLFLEVDLNTGDSVQLVDCNFEPVCAALPAP